MATDSTSIVTRPGPDAELRRELHALLYGSEAEDLRDLASEIFLQPVPVGPEVWLEFLRSEPQGTTSIGYARLLLRPHHATSAAQVAKFLRKRGVSAIHIVNVILATPDFKQFIRYVLPLTAWWRTRRIPANDRRSRPVPPLLEITKRVASIILVSGGPDWEESALFNVKRQMKLAEAKDSRKCKPLVHRIDLDRAFHAYAARAIPTSEVELESKRTIKADAAKRLFDVRCAEITWAIIDSGVADLPAFTTGAPDGGAPRIIARYDITRLESLVMSGGMRDPSARKSLVDEAKRRGRSDDSADHWAAERLAEFENLQNAKTELDWGLMEPLLLVEGQVSADWVAGDHGTQVAGIIAARGVSASGSDVYEGICPDIRLIDIKVFRSEERNGLSQATTGSEFATLAAIQLLRYLKRSGRQRVHGANLSLWSRHEVADYAAGSTPVCIETDRAAADGIMMVTASGNLGHRVRDDPAAQGGNAYEASSVTDPGNARGAITVGATHTRDPYTYGVSYFSGRGPTGDGRKKPDLVAPGERIVVLDRWGEPRQISGTSFAAPHVSAAAAMLMARHPELIGRPERIKAILCGSATDLGRDRDFQGAGLLDVLRAMQSI